MHGSDPSLLIALVLALLVFVISSARHRRLDLGDVGPVGAVFFTSFNLVPAWRILKFSSDVVDGVASLPPELVGCEKYLAGAGMLSLLITFVAIFACLRRAWNP
jgi:hypothetical protein